MSDKRSEMSKVIKNSVECVLSGDLDGVNTSLTPQEKRAQQVLATLTSQIFKQLPYDPESKDCNQTMRDYVTSLEILIQHLIKQRFQRTYKSFHH